MSLNSLFYRRQQFIGFRRFLEKSFCPFSYSIYSQLKRVRKILWVTLR